MLVLERHLQPLEQVQKEDLLDDVGQSHNNLGYHSL
jgi:hypothetical protein